MAAGTMALAAPQPNQPFHYNGRDYYVVNGNDPSNDTGAQVCAKIGKACIGYTDFSTSSCQYFHPGAPLTPQSVNGSKSGFYCDGPPQKGLACESSRNNCQVCPWCNVNADCNFHIGGLFREMYIECGGGENAASKSAQIPAKQTPSNKNARWSNLGSGILTALQSFWQSIWRGLGKIRNNVASNFASLSNYPQTQSTAIQISSPKGTINIQVQPDSQVCEFYQTKTALVTCQAYKAADTFCVLSMQSQFARALLCQPNGVIICDLPCKTTPKHQPIKACAFNNGRPRGNQAPPFGSCR